MLNKFLYEELDTLSKWGGLAKNIPASVAQNLNPRYELRPYQVEALARFFYCHQNNFPGKTYPLHVLFNMATGSGKTLIMAGLILYLYEQGYRHFLFFVNSTTIIEKTKDNFLNPAASKHLFTQEIIMGHRRARVTPVENFEAVNPHDINICFTTIQKLHSDLTSQKENALTFEDFRRHKIVLIADEAHHINVKTKAQTALFESWENTIERIFTQNENNLLLEFTATHDYATPAMVDKYRHKVITRYDLLQFRNDRFSKDVVIVQSDFDEKERILQALILSQYKQEVAASHRLNLKPVILFKAQKTIAQSQENKANFHQIIDSLTAEHITAIRRSNIPLIQRAFQFFDENNISAEHLAKRLKHEFHPDFCLSVNEDLEKERYQILLNSLEDKNNRVRAIFAVQKLNEGWDVLNLFDIVRCYEARDTGRPKIGTTTMSEAQLIGRGARYFPFVLPENSALSGVEGRARFRRKFDGDLKHELRVLEELHYHSINDSRYISEIRAALIEQGLLDEQVVEKRLTLKESFKETPFYKYGLIYVNSRLKNDYHHLHSLADLGVKKKNYVHIIATGHGDASAVLAGRSATPLAEEMRQDVKVKNLERNIVQAALARQPFFTLASLQRYFPHLNSMQTFITADDYLGGLELTFQGNIYVLKENKAEKLAAMMGLLNQIEIEIRRQIITYRGSKEFKPNLVREVFNDRVLKFAQGNALGADDPQFDYFVSNKDWFAFNTMYGACAEKAFVRMLDRHMDTLKEKYDDIYLVRNEGHFKIYTFAAGQAFAPEFVLFLREKNGALLTYQLFIEPKGNYLKDHDHWQETFLKEITAEFGDKILKFDQWDYRLMGVPFYHNEDENRFKASLETALN